MDLRFDMERQLDDSDRSAELTRVKHDHLAQICRPPFDQEHHPPVPFRRAVRSRDEDGLLHKTIPPRVVVLGLAGRVPVLCYTVEPGPDEAVVGGAFGCRIAVRSRCHDVQPGYVVGSGEEPLVETGEFTWEI